MHQALFQALKAPAVLESTFRRGGAEDSPQLLPPGHHLYLCPEPQTHRAQRQMLQSAQACLWKADGRGPSAFCLPHPGCGWDNGMVIG